MNNNTEKIKKFSILTLLALFSLATQAQIVSSRTSMTTRQVIEKDLGEWSTFYIQWNPSSIKPDGGSSESFNGYSIGYNKAISLTQSQPIFLELGLAAQYSYKNKKDTNEGYISGYGWYSNDVESTFTMVSAKIPVQLDYVFNIPNTNIDLVPNLGLDLRFNIIGKVKQEAGGDSESIDLFDDDDMGDNAWKRFQIGWHIGINAMFNKQFMVGLSYGSDFSEIAEKTKINTTSLTVGLCF
jgi:hypothetical protein